MDSNYSLLVLPNGDNEVLFEYEKSLYKAFSNQNVDIVWEVDKITRTMKPIVDYVDQIIYAIKSMSRNKFIAGLSINFNVKNKMQIEMEGFEVNKENIRICEILYMFSLMDFIGGSTPIKLLTEPVFNKIRAMNITLVYATCSPRKLSAYKYIGFTEKEEKEIGGEREVLLELKMDGVDFDKI
jgi:hypothetical protein